MIQYIGGKVQVLKRKDNYFLLYNPDYRNKQLKNPIVGSYYNKIDSIALLDSNDVFKLLSKANYKYYYGKFLLYKLAEKNPELLIQYIDKNPLNKKAILLAIRNHNNFKEITKNIEEADLTSKGKKQITKQKSKRVITDVGIGTVYFTVVISEVALLTAFTIWIFKN